VKAAAAGDGESGRGWSLASTAVAAHLATMGGGASLSRREAARVRRPSTPPVQFSPVTLPLLPSPLLPHVVLVRSLGCYGCSS
jgi:hypothetical protein